MSKKRTNKNKKTNANSPVIEAVNIEKDFGDNHVLKGINLSVNKKDFITIMGRSGSGKSTLLYVISGIEEATKGEVFVQGKGISGLNDRDLSIIRTQKIGFVFQFYNLMQSLTAKENILLPAQVRGAEYEELEERYEKIIDLVDLRSQQDKIPSEMSGGQQQRVAIARALINNPEILMADELTGNLDNVTSENVMNILKNINKELGVTILHVSHDRELVKYGNRIITLNDGQIIDDTRI